VKNFHIEFNQNLQSIWKFVLKLLRAHKKSKFFAASYFKTIQSLKDMHFCSSCVPNLIKWRTVYYWEFIFELLGEMKSLDVKIFTYATVYVH